MKADRIPTHARIKATGEIQRIRETRWVRNEDGSGRVMLVLENATQGITTLEAELCEPVYS